MSLDVWLIENKPTRVYDGNITHNLNAMASEVKLKDNLTLYDVLWHPEDVKIKQAGELAPHLMQGLKMLTDEPERYKTFNPPNGWGSYDGFVQFVREYLAACIVSPEAEIGVWR